MVRSYSDIINLYEFLRKSDRNISIDLKGTVPKQNLEEDHKYT